MIDVSRLGSAWLTQTLNLNLAASQMSILTLHVIHFLFYLFFILLYPHSLRKQLVLESVQHLLRTWAISGPRQCHIWPASGPYLARVRARLRSGKHGEPSPWRLLSVASAIISNQLTRRSWTPSWLGKRWLLAVCGAGCQAKWTGVVGEAAILGLSCGQTADSLVS